MKIKKSFKEQGNCHHISVVSGRYTLKGLPAEEKQEKHWPQSPAPSNSLYKQEKQSLLHLIFSLKENCLQITIIINEHD